MCRNEIIIMMERERVLSWPELCLTGSWPALDPFTLIIIIIIEVHMIMFTLCSDMLLLLRYRRLDDNL